MTMDSLSDAIKERYASIATKLTQPSSSCSSSCCSASDKSNSNPITRDLYPNLESKEVPKKAIQASLGCGNPTALVEILTGQTVLDLGSGNSPVKFVSVLTKGGGIDCILSAKRVGPAGKVYGLDMTESMITLARQNVEEAGLSNVDFILGSMESIPLPANSVDVIISNCVINLSLNKDAALEEAYRILKKGGKFAVSDIVVRNSLPEDVKKSMEMWTGCVAGALLEKEYIAKLKNAGFADVSVEEVRTYTKTEVLSGSV